MAKIYFLGSVFWFIWLVGMFGTCHAIRHFLEEY